MSSGIYAALSGAITKMQAVDVLAGNLSNVNTPGYKKDRVHFAAVLNDELQMGTGGGMNYSYVPNTQTDFSQGVMEPTQNDFDVAINGDGFFKVRRGEEILFTRLGNFARGADGTLVTRSGEQVLSADNQSITIPEGQIAIDESGSILSAEGEVGRVEVFTPDERLLHKQGWSQFSYSGNDQGVAVSSDAQVYQHHLERSNVKSMEETTIMMNSLRGFESYQKVMKNYYELDAQANEIGSL
jgi:flagellar basal body rod protein FlgG